MKAWEQTMIVKKTWVKYKFGEVEKVYRMILLLGFLPIWYSVTDVEVLR